MAKKGTNTTIAAGGRRGQAEGGREAALEKLHYCISVLLKDGARSREDKEVIPALHLLSPQ